MYELLIRLDALHDKKDTRVAFAAHSQGTQGSPPPRSCTRMTKPVNPSDYRHSDRRYAGYMRRTSRHTSGRRR